MLFSSIQEINSIYPTSRWDDLDSLLNPLQKVERTKLVRYLGTPLLRKLNEEYALILDQQGGILAQHIDDTPLSSDSSLDDSSVLSDSVAEPTPSLLTIDILRSCQEIILYMTLSDNIRILSSSLNRGGGFNSMTADDYDQSNDKQLSALKAETWHQAMDSVENLLRLLEQDAQEDQLYTALWKQSHYYYHHSDLLFTTAEDLNHYLNIQDSRDRYITLLPAIRNAQDNYLAGRIGTDLLEDIISGTVKNVNGESVSLGSSPWGRVGGALTKYLKQALANYVAASSEYISSQSYNDKSIKQATLASQEAHGNGDMQLALASRLIVTNSTLFTTYIQNSKTLQSIYQTETGTEWTTVPSASPLGSTTVPSASPLGSSCPLQSDISDRSYSALADFGGLHLN